MAHEPIYADHNEIDVLIFQDFRIRLMGCLGWHSISKSSAWSGYKSITGCRPSAHRWRDGQIFKNWRQNSF